MGPVLSGTFFINAKPNMLKPGYSEFHGIDFHHAVPSWVYETIKLLNKEPIGTRVLVLPSARTHVYYWGYGSSNDVLMENQNNGIVSANYGEGYKMGDSFDLKKKSILSCISKFLDCNLMKFKDELRDVGLSLVIFRNDFNCDLTKCLGDKLKPADFLKLFPEAKTTIQQEWTILKLFNSEGFIFHSPENGIVKNLEFKKFTSFLPIYVVTSPRGLLNLNVPYLSGWMGLRFNQKGWPEILIFEKNTSGRPQVKIKYDTRLFIFYKGFFLFVIALGFNLFIILMLPIYKFLKSSFEELSLWKT